MSRDYLTHFHQQTQTTAMSSDYTDEERRAWEVPDEDEADGDFVLALSATKNPPPSQRLLDRPRIATAHYVPGVSISLICNSIFTDHFVSYRKAIHSLHLPKHLSNRKTLMIPSLCYPWRPWPKPMHEEIDC